MIPDSSGMPEPDRDRFNFSKGQGVRIVDGAFTEYIGAVVVHPSIPSSSLSSNS